MWGLCGLRTGVLVESTEGEVAMRVFSPPRSARAIPVRPAGGSACCLLAGKLWGYEGQLWHPSAAVTWPAAAA